LASALRSGATPGDSERLVLANRSLGQVAANFWNDFLNIYLGHRGKIHMEFEIIAKIFEISPFEFLLF
jgi:hypothetical protein